MAPHQHDHQHVDSRGLLTRALFITLAMSFIEGLSGHTAGSVALMSDAGHMLGDAGALGIALLGSWLARRPPSRRHSFGLARADILSATINALLLLVLTGFLVRAAMQRFDADVSIDSPTVIVVGFIGLLVNLWVMSILGHSHDLNARAARLHVIGDLLGSLAAITAGIVIFLTGWTPIDAMLSLFICGLILISATRVLWEAVQVFMEAVPRHLDLDEVGKAMASIDGVYSVHDLHIWRLSGSTVSLSAHVLVSDLTRWTDTLAAINSVLSDRYSVDHVTLQPELIETVPLPEPTLSATSATSTTSNPTRRAATQKPPSV